MTTRHIVTALTTLATFSGLISVSNSVVPNSAIAQSKESKPEVVELKEDGDYKPIAVAYFREFLLSGSRETPESAERRLAQASIKTAVIDLNGDGQVEIIAGFMGDMRYCAKIGGCPMTILQKKSGQWQPISPDRLMAFSIQLDRGTTKGYRNLIAGRAGFQHNSRLIFDGQQYVPVGLVVPDNVIAQPTSKAKGCLNSRIVTNAGIVRESYRVGNFVLNDGTGSSINVREKPTTESSIQYVAPSRRGVSIFEQVVGTDDYCWIKVEGQIWDKGNTRPIGIFSGWVRGDFVKMET
ncbi:MAG: SH3 domain-containing protein [Pseudanabaena sp. ELA607]|jgi:hypothetical protein